MDKLQARALVRERKRKMSNEEIVAKSKKIQDRLTSKSCFLEAEVLYCYISYNQEVITKPLLQMALDMGKRVAVPKVYGKDMEFIYLSSLDELEKGYQGILEPIGDQCAKEEKVLMLLPGLAFDEQRNRVGYGGGFYDRYLEKNKEKWIYKIALAFDFQILENLEMEACDWKVDEILTEKRRIGG